MGGLEVVRGSRTRDVQEQGGRQIARDCETHKSKKRSSEVSAAAASESEYREFAAVRRGLAAHGRSGWEVDTPGGWAESKINPIPTAHANRGHVSAAVRHGSVPRGGTAGEGPAPGRVVGWV